jgi:hypothetical protein
VSVSFGIAESIPMRMLRPILVATVALLAACAPRTSAPPSSAAFSFALIGDAPYGTRDEGPFARILERIGGDPAIRVVLHAGDIKASSEPCSDELLRRRLAQFQVVRTALVYTPGDNEWTDCHRTAAGGFHPLERLATLRRFAYPDPHRSFGRQPLALESQADCPGQAEFVENARFTYERVVFVTLHVTGSNNGLEPWRSTARRADSPGTGQMDAFKQREAANLAWLVAAFDHAHAGDAIAIVILLHANPRFELPPGDGRRAGFEALIGELSRLAAEFRRPVLLLHGDGHVFFVDRPLAGSSPPAPNLRRVQTFGYPWMGWIRIDVDAARDDVFRIESGTQNDVIGG